MKVCLCPKKSTVTVRQEPYLDRSYCPLRRVTTQTYTVSVAGLMCRVLGVRIYQKWSHDTWKLSPTYLWLPEAWYGTPFETTTPLLSCAEFYELNIKTERAKTSTLEKVCVCPKKSTVMIRQEPYLDRSYCPLRRVTTQTHTVSVAGLMCRVLGVRIYQKWNHDIKTKPYISITTTSLIWNPI